MSRTIERATSEIAKNLRNLGPLSADAEVLPALFSDSPNPIEVDCKAGVSPNRIPVISDRITEKPNTLESIVITTP